MSNLKLRNVTLCAVTSVNLEQTINALNRSMDGIDFGRVLLLTDCKETVLSFGIDIVPIVKITTSSDYSTFIIRNLAQYIDTHFVMIVQWDGFVIDPESWCHEFLDYDYIGASWPQFDDGHLVGNGGFSLRSRKLLEACRDPGFVLSHPEDVSICRTNRPLLEEKFNIRFADKAVADRFSFERHHHGGPTFGFHGAFNLIKAIGAPAFWDMYCGLDDKKSVFADYWSIMAQALMHARKVGLGRSIRMIARLSADYRRYRLGRS